jgi:Sulfotransferase family
MGGSERRSCSWRSLFAVLISHKKRFLFVHIYKTGGTSVARRLATYARFRQQIAVRYSLTRGLVNTVSSMLGLEGDTWYNGIHKHATALELRAWLGPSAYDAYYKFAFVRNPWDWQCSNYHYIRGSKMHRDHDVARRLPFKGFIQYQIDMGAPCQLDFLADEEGRVIVDKIGRYESLQADFDEIAQKLGLPRMILSRVNASDRPRDYRACYDAASEDLVRSYFARDIEYFGYSYSDGH